jgi:hypothetical protein
LIVSVGSKNTSTGLATSLVFPRPIWP